MPPRRSSCSRKWKHASRHACLARRAANHGHGPPPYGGSPDHHGRHLAQSLDGPDHESGYAGHGRCHDVPYLAGPFLAVLSHARAPYLSHAPSHARVPGYPAGPYVRDHVIGSGGHGPSGRACDHGYDCPIGCATDFAPCRGLPCHSVHARGAGEWGQKGKHDQKCERGRINRRRAESDRYRSTHFRTSAPTPCRHQLRDGRPTPSSFSTSCDGAHRRPARRQKGFRHPPHHPVDDFHRLYDSHACLSCACSYACGPCHPPLLAQASKKTAFTAEDRRIV